MHKYNMRELFKDGERYAGLHSLDFKLAPDDIMVDIGGGQNSHPRANIVVEPFLEDNSQRLGRDLKLRDGQELVTAMAEDLPFEDQSIKLAFSSHVAEHIEDLPAALDEMNRVAEWIFMAYPRGGFEMFSGKPEWGHKNLLTYIDDTLFIQKRHNDSYSQYFAMAQHMRWHGDSQWRAHWEEKERWVWEDRILVKTPIRYKVVQ